LRRRLPSCPWLQLQARTREQIRTEGRARQAKPRAEPVPPRRCAATASYFFLAPAKSRLGTVPSPLIPVPPREVKKRRSLGFAFPHASAGRYCPAITRRICPNQYAISVPVA